MKKASLNSLAWKKLKSNKMSFSALLFVVVCLFVGILAVPISPDKTPMANQMHIELATLKPFTKVVFLEITKEDVNQASLFEGIFFGKPLIVKRIPISTFTKTRKWGGPGAWGAGGSLFVIFCFTSIPLKPALF